jgi:hypothetical protein
MMGRKGKPGEDTQAQEENISIYIYIIRNLVFVAVQNKKSRG